MRILIFLTMLVIVSCSSETEKWRVKAYSPTQGKNGQIEVINLPIGHKVGDSVKPRLSVRYELIEKVTDHKIVIQQGDLLTSNQHLNYRRCIRIDATDSLDIEVTMCNCAIKVGRPDWCP